MVERLILGSGSRLHARDDGLLFDAAVEEIKAALKLPHETALALLAGLCATGSVGSYDKKKNFIDPDKTPMGDAARPLLISTVDFREWMRDHCHVSLDRDAEITRKLRDGEVPGKSIPWKDFCNAIRDVCGGWLGKGPKRRPTRGFGDKQIQRIVRQQDI